MKLNPSPKKIKAYTTKMLLGILFVLLISIPAIVAQKPSNLPDTNGEPVDFFGSFTNILVYIILPVTILILFVIWRRRHVQKQRRQKQEKKDQETNS